MADRVLESARRALLAGRASVRFGEAGTALAVKPIPGSACRVACPAGVNVKAYIGLVAAGDLARALEVVMERNPLPGICGRVCTHPCEAECRRGEVDAPVAIRQLKRFIADYALASEPPALPGDTPKTGRRVAVVGSGPAGITAANDLARLGHEVVVLEALEKPGGMLRVGIPPFRLPHDIIDHEIESITLLGVGLETGCRVEDPTELLGEGFSAVFFAAGAHVDIDLGLDLEDDLDGVVDCVRFLREANLGRASRLTGRVLVVGGGNSAIDSARTARRLGAREVRILYRRTRKEMPADAGEIEEALAEGVHIDFQVQPVGLLHDGGRLTGLRCIRTRLGRPDDSGRRRPEPVRGSEFDIDARLVIKAIGQRPDTGGLAGSGVTVTRWGTVEADTATGRTGLPGFFAGGDVATGPSTVIDAIAAGHRAARGIDAYLAGREVRSGSASALPYETELILPSFSAVSAERARPRTIPKSARRSFREVEGTFSEAQAAAEASRCLRCGPCDECVQCQRQCPRRQVSLTIPGSDGEILMRVPSLEEIFPDPARRVTVVLARPRGRPLVMEAAPVLARVDPELCRACGACVDACTHEAVSLTTWRKGLKVAVVDPGRCRGCGNCVTVCPSGALSDRAGRRAGSDD